LAEVCGRLNGFQEEQTQLDGRIGAIESGQKTLAISTQQALKAAMAAQRRLDEAEFEACLEGLNRSHPLTNGKSLGQRLVQRSERSEPEMIRISGTEDYVQDVQPEPEWESKADRAAAVRSRCNLGQHPAVHADGKGRCLLREQLNRQAQQLAELGQAVAEMLARPRRESGASQTRAARTLDEAMQTRLEQQSLLVEQMEARVWAIAEGQTRLEQQVATVATVGKEHGERGEKGKFALAAAEISKLQARLDEQDQEFNKMQAELKTLWSKSLAQQPKRATAQPAAVTDIHNAAPSIMLTPETVALAQSRTHGVEECALSETVDFSCHLSAAMQRLEVRLEASCAGVSKRCDALQRSIDQQLQKACDWLPGVEERVKNLAAQCQDSIMRTEAQELQLGSLRAEHDASCRRLLVLADHISSLTEGS
jgi:hypothetical protein